MKIFHTSKPEELICPKHHIPLKYRKENNEVVLKCEWCNYTLVPATNERKARMAKRGKA